MIGNATVVRLRRNPGGVDSHGDPVASTIERTTLVGCAVGPTYSKGRDPEIVDRGRTGAVERLSLLVPIGTDLVYTDQCAVDGVVWDVDGIPGSWKSPWSGWAPGLEVALRRSQG